VPGRVRPYEVERDCGENAGRSHDAASDQREEGAAGDPGQRRQQPRKPDHLVVGRSVEARGGELEERRLERLQDRVDLCKDALPCGRKPLAVAEVPPAREDRALVLPLLDGGCVDAGEPQQQACEQEQRDPEPQL
jgi:hypothetical protein